SEADEPAPRERDPLVSFQATGEEVGPDQHHDRERRAVEVMEDGPRMDAVDREERDAEHDLHGQHHLARADEPPVPPPGLAVGPPDPPQHPRGGRPEPQEEEERDHADTDVLVDLGHTAGILSRTASPGDATGWARTPRIGTRPPVRPRPC